MKNNYRTTLLRFPIKQRGAVLLVSMIMLLLITVIGASAINLTNLDTKMTTNARDRQIAFYAAESAIASAELVFTASTYPQPEAGVTTGFYDTAAALVDGWWKDSTHDDTWWSTNAVSIDSYKGKYDAGIAPQYIIRYLDRAKSDSDESVQGVESTTSDTAVVTYDYYYEITARGVGPGGSEVYLQSVFRYQFFFIKDIFSNSQLVSIMKLKIFCLSLLNGLTISAALLHPLATIAAPLNLSSSPLFLANSQPPLTMLVMGRDHKLYYEAYNDASDLNADGIYDVRYDPTMAIIVGDGDDAVQESRGYFGYFESNLCYQYSAGDDGGTFVAAGLTESDDDFRCTENSVGEWSGDFLNYVTTSRIDALRKVLYGGSRKTDSETKTVLERSFIPQDAHGWGKEYNSVALDGYNISDYTPYGLPSPGERHIFANFTPTVDGEPTLRVMESTPFRVWQWLAIERLGDEDGNDINGVGNEACNDYNNDRILCVSDTSTDNLQYIEEVIPGIFFPELTRSVYDHGGASHPTDADDFAKMKDDYADADGAIPYGTDRPSTIELSNSGGRDGIDDYPDDNYLTVIEGSLVIPVSGQYTFFVDGDDAIEFTLFDPDSPENALIQVGFYGAHGQCTCDDHSVTINNLEAGIYPVQFLHEDASRDDNYSLRWTTPQGVSQLSTIEDRSVKIEVCNSAIVADLQSANRDIGSCRAYGLDVNGNTIYKPAGVLQEYGETDEMMFGLMTGSYENNLEGGVLRKAVSSLADEIDPQTGIFTPLTVDPDLGLYSSGVIQNIDNLELWGFNYPSQVNRGASYSYRRNSDGDHRFCAFTTDRRLENGECNMWGNPIGEIMYEAMRYFAGEQPTDAFTYNESGSIDASLGLDQVSVWTDPYGPGGAESCANPYQFVISDINPSYDTNYIPGSNFDPSADDSDGDNGSRDNSIPFDDANNTDNTTNIITAFDVNQASIEITAIESNAALSDNPVAGSQRYIGESSLASTDDNDQEAPTSKSVAGFGTIRGLSPEEPGKQGGYTAAAVAHYGRTNDINEKSGEQNVGVYAVALASPLPEFDIPVGSGFITLVPFAKTVNVSGGNVQAGVISPTGQIVDFFVVNIADDLSSAEFLINFEDVAEGGDHDMDAIARYKYEVINDPTTGAEALEVTVISEYAGGGNHQRMGYVISGTADGYDGIYLEVRDQGGSNAIYELDTPSTRIKASDTRGTEPLGFENTRVFSPASSGGGTDASFLENPLWYAAKFGGFIEADNDSNGVLDDVAEWNSESNLEGDPDNYFLVTNANQLQTQLSDAFNDLASVNGSSSAVTVNTGSVGSDSLLFQATFDSEDWSGQVEATALNADGFLTGSSVWDVESKLSTQLEQTPIEDRVVLTSKLEAGQYTGVSFQWPENTPSAATEIGASEMSLIAGTLGEGNGQSIVDYIRGDDSSEESVSGTTGLGFRDREFALGDVINSDPIYVGAPDLDYNDTWAEIDGVTAPENQAGPDDLYSAFVANNSGRTPMLYFGANDGMFHGVNASVDPAFGGEEKLAFIPRSVLGKLESLTDPDYIHEYFVDGPATYSDVFIDGQWRTVVVGSLRGGGQGIFALDITDPDNFNGDPDDIVLWEFSDADDIDGVDNFSLGYTYGRPSIVRLANGEWAAVFGNGYNNTDGDDNISATGNAVVYLVDLADGSVIKKFNTQSGMDDDPLSESRPNGISGVTPVDIDQDNITDWLYAGDLFGNVWKIDLTGGNVDNWAIDVGSATAEGLPLFQARSADGTALPITSRITVGSHPEEDGETLLFFGTGQYLEVGDNANVGQTTQAFFGLWDNNETVIESDRDNANFSLVGQTILEEVAVEVDGVPTGDIIRATTDEDVVWSDGDRGWYMDLIVTNQAENFGERQVTNSVLDDGRIIFTTLLPSEEACEQGGSSWTMVLDATSGGVSNAFGPFDINGDGVINSDDIIDVNGDGINDASGLYQEDGQSSDPVIIDVRGKDSVITTSLSSGGPGEKALYNADARVRQNWRELR